MTLIQRLCETSRYGPQAAELIGELATVLSDMVAMLDDMGVQRGPTIDRARAVLDKAGE